MTDKSLENKFGISVPIFTKASIDARFFLELRGPGNVVVGKIIVDKGGMIFEGDADASAKVFIDELVKQWSSQWWQAQDRIAELESEVKFPGVMRCNTCGFSRSHVIVTPGGMRAGESTPEHCPNGCGPMWHDTYRRQYNELYDAYKALESRTVTVKLPPRVDSSNVPFTAHTWNCCLDAVEKCLTAAGIQVIEGEG